MSLRMKTYACPKCGRDVPLDKINVAKDIMLCPSCGETSCFSDVVGEIDERRHADDVRGRLNGAPPKHLKVECDPMDPTGRIVLTQRKFSKGAFFLVPFTCVWAGFSMTAIYGTQICSGKFELVPSLIGIPFLLGSILLISICLFMLGIGKHVLTLERGKGRFFWGVGLIGLWRNFTYDRQTRIEQGYTGYQSNGQSHLELHLTHPGSSDTVHICAGMDEDSIDYVEAVLKREVSRV